MPHEDQDIDGRGVIRGPENEFGCAIVAAANVRDIGLAGHEDLSTPRWRRLSARARARVDSRQGTHLGGAEITELDDMSCRIQQQILGFDVPMANAMGVNLGQGAAELVEVELYV